MMVVALPMAALPIVPSAAHTQTLASAVDLTGADISGSSATYTGSVASATSACGSGRTVKVTYQSANGAVLLAKGKSNSAGAFSVAGLAPPDGKAVKAKATKKVLANSASHSHTCKPATSDPFTPGDGGGGGGGGGGGDGGSSDGGGSGIDAAFLMNLPVGDEKVSSSPQRGYIYSCQTEFNGGGAFAAGPWFSNDMKTWDYTEKEDVTVSGSVNWDHELTVTVNGTKRVISANNLPNHPTGVYPIASGDDAYQYDKNPHGIEEQTVLLEVAANPTQLSTPECAGGQVGFMLTGGPMFNGFDAGGRDAVAWEIQDNCDGHPQATGVYHYHSISRCAEGASDGGHSDLLGYALDGFGMFGKYGTDGDEVTNADLDVCHGHTHTIAWPTSTTGTTSKSMYHYHLTYEFPYSVGCFRADAIQAGTGEGGGGGGSSPPGGGGGGMPPPPGG